MGTDNENKDEEFKTPAQKAGYAAGTIIGYTIGAGICAILIVVILKIMQWIWLL